MTPEHAAAARDLADAWRAVRAAEKFIRKRTWRRAVLLRSTRTSLVLRAVERAVGSRYVRREKGADRRWAVYARDESDTEVLVALVGGGSTRRLDELRASADRDRRDRTIVIAKIGHRDRPDRAS